MVTSPAPDTSQKPTIALTGSTGFLGARLIDRLVAAGYSVNALVRREQPDKEGVSYVIGDLFNEQAIADLFVGTEAIIHCAGLTKALTREDYFAINEQGTLRLLEAAAKTNGFKRFVQVSSLSAREPELSDYGASKAAADNRLTANNWPFETIALRPPAVYGPGDMELLQALKLARGAFGVKVYPSPSGLTSKAGFIHVDDLSDALIAALSEPITDKICEVDDGKPGGYAPQEIARAMTADLDTGPKVIALPGLLRSFVGSIGDSIALFTEKPSKVMTEQLRYLAHPDWSVHAEDQWRPSTWQPKYQLQDGMAKTIKWYQDNNHLPQ